MMIRKCIQVKFRVPKIELISRFAKFAANLIPMTVMIAKRNNNKNTLDFFKINQC